VADAGGSSAARSRPFSTYGFQKLATEYTPRDSVGTVQLHVHHRPAFQLRRVGERRALVRTLSSEWQRQTGAEPRRSGLISEGAKGQDPAPDRRGNSGAAGTYGADLGRAFSLCIDTPRRTNGTSTQHGRTNRRTGANAEMLGQKLTEGVPFR